MNINSMVNYCLGLSYYDLENFAGQNYKKVHAHIASKHGGDKANTLLIGSIFTCIATDGKLSEGEWKFIASFIGGYTYDEAFKVASEFYCDEAEKTTRDLIDFLPSDVAEALVSVCIAVLAVDGRMEGPEMAFLRSL
ncbi:MAG: TerB family tellurite resistance protein [Clostridiales bacterium]|nr:TerB family tellurite resistance protein [Clostridiales bacterium]